MSVRHRRPYRGIGGKMQRTKNYFLKIFVSVLILAIVFASGLFAQDKAQAAETDNEYVGYVLEDNFSEYNAGNWSLYQEPYLSGTVPPQYVNPITVSGGLTIASDYTESGADYEGARMVSNVRFAKDPSRSDDENYTVFDTSFVVYLNNKSNRQRDISYGVLFGLPEKNASMAQGSYFKLNSSQFFLYSGGELMEPEYLVEGGSNSLGGYIEYDFKLEVNLVARSNGDLYVYLGFPDGKSITDAYCKYSGLNFEGYLGYMATSHDVSKTEFSVNFDSIKLTGGTIADYNFSVISAACAAGSLTSAIVSEKPIPLAANIVTSPNLPQYHRATFSVVSGNAEIRNGDELYIHGTGPIVLRTSAYYDSSVNSDFTFSATDLEISAIKFTNSFEDITVNTQPFRLIAQVTSNSYIPAHNEVVFEVISGNAEIFCDRYLKINGAGTVILRATSTLLDDAFTTVTFEVSDPDAAFVPTDGNDSSSCKSNSGTITKLFAVLLAAAGCMLFGKKSG